MMGLKQTSTFRPFRLSPETERANGFILIPVLWVLGFLALVTAILTRTVSTDIKASANLLTRAQSEVLSDGIARLAIRYAVANPIDGANLGAFTLNGTPAHCRVGNSIAAISIASTAGLVDINTATAATLELLFTAIGAPNPAGLAAAVIDFRDPDDVPTPGGAELAEYRAANLTHGPKNAPFITVGELDQVLGMTPELFARARPFVTTVSRLATPDLTLASPEIVAMSFPAELSNQTRTRYLRITVSVRRASNSRQYTREAVLLLEPRVRGGFLLKGWERTALHINQSMNFGEAIPSEALPSCVDQLLLVKS